MAVLVDAAVWAVVEDADDPTVAVAVAADDAATELVDTAVDATEAVEVEAALDATELVDVDAIVSAAVAVEVAAFVPEDAAHGAHCAAYVEPLTYALLMHAVPAATDCHALHVPAAVHMTNPSAQGDTACRGHGQYKTCATLVFKLRYGAKIIKHEPYLIVGDCRQLRV